MSKPPEQPGSLVVRARGLLKGFGVGELRTEVLRGVDLDVSQGEFAVLVGPSGCGKTTLLQLLGALDVLDGGTLEVAGVDLTGAGERERARFRLRHLGFVFQFFHLLPMLSARENVEVVLEPLALSRSERRTRVDQALADVGLADRADRFPHQLSGGQQQRVGIARALAKRPTLLLADEPTGSLDRERGAAIIDLLDAARLHTTVVAVTHDPAVVARGTVVSSLVDGRIE